MTEPSKKQLELEQSICSISAYNKISKQNKNIEKGRESENYYARNIIESGLQKLSKAIQDHIDESLSGKVGVKAVSALFLSQFPDIDVVSFIAFKVLIDNASQLKTTTSTALKIGQMLEDELRFTKFEEQDPKHFRALKKHTRDTKNEGYKRNLMVYHMNNKGHEFKSWTRGNKLRVGLKLIELIMVKINMVSLVNKRVRNTTTSYIVFTDRFMKYIRQGRSNRIAAFPIYLPCLDPPREWTSITEGGYYTDRLKTKAIKSSNQDYLNKLQGENLTTSLKALTLASQTAWGVNQFVLETLEYCWEERIEVGSLIDRELAELPTKPLDINTNKEARKEWRYLASLIHDMNAQNMVKRYQILSMIDTAKRYVGEKFYHVYQFDFTGRMYPLTAHFHPQGNDIARGLHKFSVGSPINTKQDMNKFMDPNSKFYGNESYLRSAAGADGAEDFDTGMSFIKNAKASANLARDIAGQQMTQGAYERPSDRQPGLFASEPALNMDITADLPGYLPYPEPDMNELVPGEVMPPSSEIVPKQKPQPGDFYDYPDEKYLPSPWSPPVDPAAVYEGVYPSPITDTMYDDDLSEDAIRGGFTDNRLYNEMPIKVPGRPLHGRQMYKPRDTIGITEMGGGFNALPLLDPEEEIDYSTYPKGRLRSYGN